MMDLTLANVIQDIKNGMTNREVLTVNNVMILMNALHQLQHHARSVRIGLIVIVLILLAPISANATLDGTKMNLTATLQSLVKHSAKETVINHFTIVLIVIYGTVWLMKYDSLNNSMQDFDECDPIDGNDICHDDATCTNTDGTYTCQCNTGYQDPSTTPMGYVCQGFNLDCTFTC